MSKSSEERFKILESEDISTGPENDTYILMDYTYDIGPQNDFFIGQKILGKKIQKTSECQKNVRFGCVLRSWPSGFK